MRQKEMKYNRKRQDKMCCSSNVTCEQSLEQPDGCFISFQIVLAFPLKYFLHFHNPLPPFFAHHIDKFFQLPPPPSRNIKNDIK